MNRKVFMFILMVMSLICQSQTFGQNRPAPRQGRDLPPAMEREVLQVFQDMRPEEYSRIIRLKESEPKVYRQELRDLAEKHQRILLIKKQDPEQYRHLVAEQHLNARTLQLAGDIQALQDGFAKQEKLAELKTMLYDLFEQRQFNRKQEIARLEEKLQELKASDQQREEKKDEIVQKRLNELLNQQEDLEW